MRKRTLLIALAVAAALTVTGIGAVRCASSAMGPASTEVQSEPATENGADDGGQAATSAGAVGILSTHTWIASDGSGTALEFREGAWVEKGSKLEATAYEAQSETSTATQTVLTVVPIRNGLSSEPSAVIIGGKEGGYTVTSDAFALSREYVQTSSEKGDFKVTGVDARFYELSGADEPALAKAIGDYCAKRIPAAGSASFDGEVFLDLKSGLCSATFHADDASRTIVTVTMQSGKITVAS